MHTTESGKQEDEIRFKQYWKREKYKFFMGFASTAGGVLIALLINSGVSAHSEKQTYEAMLKAVKIEARANRIILTNSFLPNYKGRRIVFRNFSANSLEECMKQKTFIQFAPEDLIEVLTDYRLEMVRSNAFRSADEKYKYDPHLDSIWGDTLRIAWGISLHRIDTLISKVDKFVE